MKKTKKIKKTREQLRNEKFNKEKQVYVEKFNKMNTDNNFTLIDVYRNKEKKRTFLKIECKKCNDVFEKEQYCLFHNNKSIFCFKCENKKKPERITEEIIRKELSKQNAEFIEYYRDEGSFVHVVFRCECGNIDNKLFDYNKPWYCGSCIPKKCSTTRKSVYDFIEKIKEFGCTPMFEVGDYQNSNTSLPIKCKCGNIFTTRFSKFKDENYKLRCSRCMHEEYSGENHWRWKGGIKRRFENEEHWERKIKRRFNYTCIITGNTDRKNLTAHHLNCYKDFPDQRLDIANGVCITKDLHKEFHLRYDKYKGTCQKEQFMEFFKEKTNINYVEFLKINSYES